METPAELPHDIKLEYLAEGAANVVFRLVSDPDPTSTAFGTADIHNLPQATSRTTPPPSFISPSPSPTSDNQLPTNQLLRLHKRVPWIPSYALLHEQQQTLIAPLFPPSDLVFQRLAILPPSTITNANATLRAYEESGIRPSKRHGLYLDETDPHGLLVQDMTPARGELLIEVKPKWLAQSPTAPGGSRRCRTCALRAMRASTSSSATATKHETGFCPLDLCSGDKDAISRAVKIIARGVDANHRNDTLDSRLVGFFLQTPILTRLRELQMRLDPQGVAALHAGDQISTDFLVATTLRDCTLFLRLSVDGGAEIEGRLGDLDLKAPEEGKVAYWQGIEHDLISGGWYLGDDGRVVGCRLDNESG